MQFSKECKEIVVILFFVQILWKICTVLVFVAGGGGLVDILFYSVFSDGVFKFF